MSNILFINKPFVSVGLGSFTFTVAQAGIHNVKVQLTEVPPSGVVVTITQNAGNVFTSPVITPTQIAQQFKTELVCAVSDAIVVTLSSAAAIDAALNNVKATITLGQGL
jgi:hypothetical protein